MRQKKTVLGLIFLLILGMILEVFGLGILFPIINIILDPEKLSKQFFYEDLASLLDYKYSFIVAFIMICTIILYLTKTLYLLFLTHKQNRFLANFIADTALNLYSIYLNQSYKYHLERNSSSMIKTIQIELSNLNSYLLALITIITETAIALSILILLIFIEPVGTITLGIIISFSTFLFFKFSKKKISNWGTLRQTSDENMSRLLVEGIRGIKEIKLLNLENFFISRFKTQTFYRARVNSNYATTYQFPRFFLEVITISSLMLFILILVFQNKDTSSLMAIMGLFLIGVFRILPSLNRSLSSYQSVKFYKSTIDSIEKEINNSVVDLSLNKLKEIKKFKNSINIDQLYFSYNQNSNYELKNINLKIEKGKLIGIKGESGSGKSTLINIITGLLVPTKGSINVDGINIFDNIKVWQSNIGYVSQDIFLFNISIKKNIALGVEENRIDENKINSIISKVSLDSFISNQVNGINTLVGENGIQISGGQRQRIGIARALYNDPDILILDEATASLDVKTENDIMKSIENLKAKKTIIIVAHRLSTLSECDEIYEIIDGNLTLSK